MAYYITVDGGGSKLNAVMFDSDLNIISRCVTGGVNTSQNSPEAVDASMRGCVEQLFGAEGIAPPAEIEAFYSSFVGPVDRLIAMIEERAPIAHKFPMGESEAGILAGAARFDGMVAIAGTGSDVFYVKPGHDFGGTRPTVGAYGPILGDFGSGVWMGQRALHAALRYQEGWGPYTLLLQLIRERWNIQRDDFELVHVIHGSGAPFRTVGQVTPLVGMASRRGDRVARGIILEAAHLMAQQTACLLRRIEIPRPDRHLVACGGAWKVSPLMFEAYRAELEGEYPDLDIAKPLFEHVMAGPVRIMLETGMPRAEAIAAVKRGFPDYIIRW